MDTQQKEIAELKQALLKANEDIEKLSKVKSDFVSVISHELRTPLTSIKESVSLVADGITGPINDNQKQFLTMARNNIDRLTKLITDILDFSKMDSGGITMHKKKMNINELIKDICNTYKGYVEKSRLEFSMDLSDDIELTWFDPKRIEQVIRNLLSNAVKFNKDKGKIRISSDKALIDGREVVKICVENTGHGISKKDIPKLFKRFSLLDTTMTRSHKGAGLGLAICKRIIDFHAGDIWVESEKDTGSRFTFTLPVYKKDKEFNFLLDEAIERARCNDLSLSLVIVGFKDKKDADERLLEELEKDIHYTIRGSEDKVVRFRGGNLIAIMAGTDKRGAMKIIERLKNRVKVLLRFGIAVYPDEVRTKGDLIRKTEEDLKKGKNCI